MKSYAYVIGLLAASAVLGLSPDADACSPPAPALTGSTPKSGDTYPANAALFFEGYDISLDGVTVTVDGQPATLQPVTDGPISKVGTLVATIQPKPAPGQTVIVSGQFCDDSFCKPTSIEFEAGAEDNTPPPSTEIASFNVYDYPDFKSSGGDCQTNSDLAWFFQLTAPALAAGESPRIWTLERASDESFSDAKEIVSTFVNGTSFGITDRELAAILGDKSAPEAFCFRVKTSDASGNTGGVSSVVCKPCNYRVDTGAQPFSPPAEPAWTSADVFPGGTCDTGAGGDPNGEDTSEGDDARCSIGVVGGSGAASGAFAGMMVALAAALRAASKRRYRS
jgi:hypothetical protein